MELVTPYTMVVSGQTGSGKTHFVSELIKHQEVLHDRKFDKIIFAFTMMQPIYIELRQKNQNLTLVEGFPGEAVEKIYKSNENTNTLVVLDDMMIETENDKRLATMFTKMRHKNVSTIFLVQNLYFKSKYMTTVTRNAHYLVVFENPRDASMISSLNRQAYPDNPNFLKDAFRQATEKPYGYLFLDFKPGGDKRLRVREGVLPNEQTFVYRPK
jgi:deoxyribodipyrimidine photolyase